MKTLHLTIILILTVTVTAGIGTVFAQNNTGVLTTMCCGLPFYLGPHPLEQFRLGVEATDVECQVPLVLVIKSENNSPACVAPENAARLARQGWFVSSYDGSGPIQTKFQSKLISQDKAIQIGQEYVKEANRYKTFNYSTSEVKASLVYYITTSFPRVSVDYHTGLPTRVMDWLDEYYQNPQWWTELEKDYLGMPSHRIEGGHVVWELDYGTCDNCIADRPMIFVDAVTGKVVDTKWLY